MFYRIIIPILTITIACTGCRKEKTTDTQPRSVLLTHPQPLSTNSTTTYPGIVEEGASVNAAFMAEGKLAHVYVKEGDRVRKGQLLATLDDSDYIIGVSQLEAQLKQMTNEKERMDAMFARHNIAPNDYEKFTAGFEQLQLQLEMAKRKLDYTRLYSPSDGFVSAKYLNDGELVGAGTPVFNIVNDSQLLASVDLPVNVYLNRDKIDGYSGAVPGIDKNIPLTLVSFSPDADNNMLYHLKLSIPVAIARQLTPGMNISVVIQTDENGQEGSLVPSRSIFSEDGKSYVWVYNAQDSTISKTQVVVKGSPIGKNSIVDGLDGEATIVEVGVRQLYEGEKVIEASR